MPDVVACGNAFLLKRFLLGENLEHEEIATHIDGCPRCLEVLKGLPAEDEFVNVLRVAPARSDCEEMLSHLVARVQSLVPAIKEADVAWDAADSPPPASTHGGGQGGAHGEGEKWRDGDDTLEEMPFGPPRQPGELGRLAGHRILKLLGTGGMGKVYLAEDLKLNRRVAVKVMHAVLARDPRARRRFLMEARHAASIDHENTIPIYQVGEDRGIPFFSMPVLSGETLENLLVRQEALAPRQVVDVSIQIAKGLAAAHAKGLIHRDIKPANIWIEQEGGGRVKILDFGLARDISRDVHLTSPGALLGTPAYMPPEQARGEPLDPRCDLYSLGCVMYRMATGRLPIQGNDILSLLVELALRPPASPNAFDSSIPLPLSDLLMTLLAKDRQDRPASAAEVVVALERMAHWTPTLAPPAGLETPATGAAGRRWTNIGPRTAIVASLLMLALAAGVCLLVSLPGLDRSDSAADPAARPTTSWETTVLSLPARQQVDAILEELKERNPGFDGHSRHRIRGDQVIELELDGSWIVDVAAVRVLVGLERFSVRYLRDTNNFALPLKDISPLQGLKLKSLDLGGTKVADLSPLKGMPLEKLEVRETPVATLAPLEGMKLKSLDIYSTEVADLKPLAGMPLNLLVCANQVRDFTPLRGMPLKVLYFHNDSGQCGDASVFKGLPLEELHCSGLWPDLSPLADSPIRRVGGDDWSEGALQNFRKLKSLRIINDRPAREVLSP